MPGCQFGCQTPQALKFLTSGHSGSPTITGSTLGHISHPLARHDHSAAESLPQSIELLT
jgi:hypothetical protein